MFNQNDSFYPYTNPAQPMQPMPQFNRPNYNQQVQPVNNMIWVQGEAGAKSYLMAPDSTIPLWDSENQCIYVKSTDKSGIPKTIILDYTIREEGTEKPKEPVQIFVSRKDFDDMCSKIELLEQKLNSMKKSGNDNRGNNQGGRHNGK